MQKHGNLLQWPNCFEYTLLLSQAPVFGEFGQVKLPPLLDQTKRSWVDVAGDFSGLDIDGDFLPLVFGVEMRRRMIPPVHVDQDPKKSTDNGH
jgi:hypothetical protein